MTYAFDPNTTIHYAENNSGMSAILTFGLLILALTISERAYERAWLLMRNIATYWTINQSTTGVVFANGAFAHVEQGHDGTTARLTQITPP